MRRAVTAVLALALAACASPAGTERSGCGPEWLDVPSVLTEPDGTDGGPIAIECMQQIRNRRVRIGFTLPPGPSCHQLARVELVESADAVAITLIGGVNDDPAAGACPEEPRPAATEVDLAAPLDERTLLDGSAP